MTPQKKATELIDVFINCLGDDAIGKAYAKDCALMCIEQAQTATAFFNHKVKNEFEECQNHSDHCFWSYWEEVKQEIEKL